MLDRLLYPFDVISDRAGQHWALRYIVPVVTVVYGGMLVYMSIVSSYNPAIPEAQAITLGIVALLIVFDIFMTVLGWMVFREDQRRSRQHKLYMV